MGRGRAGGQPVAAWATALWLRPTDRELWACRAALTVWKVPVSSSRTAKMVLSELPCTLEDWPEHSTCTCNGDRKQVFALAVSFSPGLFLPPGSLFSQLSILPHFCISQPQVHWKPGLGAGSGASMAQSNAQAWSLGVLFFSGNQGTVGDHPSALVPRGID